MEAHPRICGWTRPRDWPSWVPRRPSIFSASSPRRARRSCGSSARSCSPRCKRMLVDAHAHLDSYSDRAEVVARAKAAGLVHVVAVGQWREGAGMAGAQDAIALAKEDRSFFSATAGIHPHDAARATEADFMELRRMCADPDVAAVGECGLDFHYDRSPRDVQRSVFVRQIRLAKELGKPLVVHTRDADVETAQLLRTELGP